MTPYKSYREMRDKKSELINSIPMGCAFSDRQFDEMMKNWGLDPEKDLSKIVSIGIPGCFLRKTDIDLYHATWEEADRIEKEFRDSDTNGDRGGLLYDMFLSS